jgi:hypothetical protein
MGNLLGGRNPANRSLYPRTDQSVDTRSLQHDLSHKNIQHPVRYTALSPERFCDFSKDSAAAPADPMVLATSS